jgi:hypothetical protein
MSADCLDCEMAARQQWAGFRSDCQGCSARSFSRSAELFDLRQSRDREGYAATLARLGLTHEDVQAAAKADVLSRKATA